MIKKIFVFSLLLAFATRTTAYAQDSINICINDVDIKFTGNRSFIDENGRTLAPFRTVLESFGADVNWDSNARTVHITTTTATKDTEDTFSSVKFKNPVIEEIIREKLHLENNESIKSQN